jgi:hypothetical protein
VDQTINYRVNIDDNNFQAKLTQMRASMDQTFMGSQMLGAGGSFGGGMGGFGGGYTPAYAMSMLSPGIGTGAGGNGLMTPSTYSPPGIAFTPHYGMNVVRQTFAQSLGGIMGLTSLNPFTSGQTPTQFTPMDYAAMSQKNLVAKLGDAATTGISTAATVGAGFAGMSVGAFVGEGIGAGIGAAILPGFGAAPGAVIGGFIGGVVGESAGVGLMSRPIEHAITRREVQSDLMKSTQGIITSGPDVDPLSGRGISNKAAREQAGALELLSTEKGQTYNFKDLATIQSSGMKQGLYSQAKSADDITALTRDYSQSVREITSTLHKTLEEAVGHIARLKESGITNQATIRSDVIQTSIRSREAGLTTQQVTEAGMQGMAIVQGTGMDMHTFQQAAEDTRTKVQQAYHDAHAITEQMVAQKGGGEQGLQAIANDVTAGNAAAQQTNMGEMRKMAVFDPKTGGLIPNAEEVLRTASPEKLAAMAAKNYSNPRNMMLFNRAKTNLYKDHPEIENNEMENQIISGGKMLMREYGVKDTEKNREAAEYTYATGYMHKTDVEIDPVLAMIKDKSTPEGRARIETAKKAAMEKEVESQISERRKENILSFLNPLARKADQGGFMVTRGGELVPSGGGDMVGAIEDWSTGVTGRLSKWVNSLGTSDQERAQIRKDIFKGHEDLIDKAVNDTTQHNKTTPGGPQTPTPSGTPTSTGPQAANTTTGAAVTPAEASRQVVAISNTLVSNLQTALALQKQIELHAAKA